jgi:hypothetical protein
MSPYFKRDLDSFPLPHLSKMVDNFRCESPKTYIVLPVVRKRFEVEVPVQSSARWSF